MTKVAETILEQLGGRRFIAMTGAKSFVGSENSLTFSLPTTLTKKRGSGMLIRLDASDTYTVQFRCWDRKALEHRVLDERCDVHAEDLRRIFTTMTGLDTNL